MSSMWDGVEEFGMDESVCCGSLDRFGVDGKGWMGEVERVGLCWLIVGGWMRLVVRGWLKDL